MRVINLTLTLALVILLPIGLTVFAGQKEMTGKDAPMAKMTKMTTMSEMATVGKPAPNFTLMDASGEKHSLSDYGGKYVVLEWINFDCPFVKKHYNSKNMQMLQEKYREKGVVWLSICSSGPGKQGYFEGKALKEHISKSGNDANAYLIDADGMVGRMYEAKTTPNMYVISPKGILLYAGAIDDSPSTDVADVATATNYVSAALDASMTGKDVTVKATQPYGCSVKYSSK